MNPSMNPEPVLELKNVSVAFKKFKAVSNVTATVHKNEIHCFIGPNGAGKTTLLDTICGKNRPSGGDIIYHDGAKAYSIPKMREYEIAGAGVGRKFQAPSIFHSLTVQANMEMAAAKQRSLPASVFGKLSAEDLARIDDALDFVGLRHLRAELPEKLSHGQKQWLEISMICVMQPKLMLLDEPVAGMGVRETEKTAELLRIIQQNCTIIVVEHDMKFVRDVSTGVTVLHEGRLLCEGSMDEVQRNQQVIEVYLGRGGE
jgi:urea transport system ATP-binding protein